MDLGLNILESPLAPADDAPAITAIEPPIVDLSAAPAPPPATTGPTIWGLNPTQLHDRYWASRGVQVVRQGERSEIVVGADLFLLTDPRLLSLFGLSRLAGSLWWDKADAICVRLHDRRNQGYRERIVADDDGQLIGFRRQYRSSDPRLARVVLTRSRQLARLWQQSTTPRQAWIELKEKVPRYALNIASAKASVYDRIEDEEVMEFCRRLVQDWKQPDATIQRQLKNQGGVWSDRQAQIGDSVRFIGPAWVGAGRKLDGPATVIGPAMLWDDPSHRPQIETLRWDEIQPAGQIARPIRPRRQSSFSRVAKRIFDVVMSIIGLALTVPFYPIIMLAIWLEDGRPFFFTLRRETMGGAEFSCLKFRSMSKDAEKVKLRLQQVNKADGPHFYFESDPRLTRVGALLRKTNIDELPQLWNVLLGQMSLVGPRPSPYSENQFCPAWREARLSMRPGITGLWQVRRTRKHGLDFQEWIKYDIEYVENAGWIMDLTILWQTIGVVLKRENRR
jgi:lipopolysaccharide/colanic/teichoic acid biosynthesis glycosyltransferase